MSTLTQLHQAIAQVAPIDGVARLQEGGHRIDFKVEATADQRSEAEAIAASFTPTPEPNWQSLKSIFISPGNLLYESVRDKMAASGCLKCADQFGSLKMLIADPALWNVDALSFGINTLSASLTEAGHPLSASDINEWNTLLSAWDFPASCQLPTE